MLDVLCGSGNVQRILMFLYVHRKCYGMQLHHTLKTALTPIQKTLHRLERGGVVTSYYAGKTRLYQFNSAYPLLEELEHLLKKAYSLLPETEKRRYLILRNDSKKRFLNQEQKIEIIDSFWKKLNGITRLTFEAASNSNPEKGWNGKGHGRVTLTHVGDQILIFNEKGSWQGKSNKEMNFSNVFRWSVDPQKGVISLEHLRRGVENPVFLFYLEPTSKKSLSSLESHLCERDFYSGSIYFDKYAVRLTWRVIGPKKNEEINYYYF